MGLRHLRNLLTDASPTLPVLALALTDGCNSRCVTCDLWRNPRAELPWERVEAVARELRALGTRYVLLGGAEPTQHSRWPEVASRLREEGARVGLLTNGLTLQRQAREAARGVDEVFLSVDAGTRGTYAAIRGVDGLERVLAGLAEVVSRGGEVRTRTTVQRANAGELPRVAERALAAGARSVSFLPVDVRSAVAFGPRAPFDAHAPPATLPGPEELRALEDGLTELESRFAEDFARGRIAESPEKLRRLPGYFRALRGEGAFPPVRCNAPHVSAVLELDGTLRGCFFLPSAVRWREGSLRDALAAPELRAQRGQYARGERPECEACVCPLYRGAGELARL